jgi:hypothetical protein
MPELHVMTNLSCGELLFLLEDKLPVVERKIIMYVYKWRVIIVNNSGGTAEILLFTRVAQERLRLLKPQVTHRFSTIRACCK